VLRKVTKVDYAIAIAVLRRSCDCNSPDKNPPTDWQSKARIPHHVDCGMFALELPDEKEAPAAFKEAQEVRTKLLAEVTTC
jgi:hypothetical protein